MTTTAMTNMPSLPKPAPLALYANIVDVRSGHKIEVSDGGGYNHTTEGIDSGRFNYGGTWAHQGDPCFYLAKGDGTAVLLRPVRQLVADMDGNVFEPVEVFPLDGVSMAEIKRRQRDEIRTRMLAAGFTAEEIETAASSVE